MTMIQDKFKINDSANDTTGKFYNNEGYKNSEQIAQNVGKFSPMQKLQSVGNCAGDSNAGFDLFYVGIRY